MSNESTHPHHDRVRLMVAEDDPDMAHVLAFLLRREGWEVELVRDGRDALRQLQGGANFDVIVLDVMMPYLSGLHVVRELRTIPACSKVPVVMVSGKGSEADVVAALSAGANDYITKPFRPREFIARIRGLLQRQPGRATRVA